MSADLLLPEDATDPSNGELPNDDAVVDLLLQRGKYAVVGDNKIGAHGYTWGLKRFFELKWPTHGTMTHTARLDIFLTSWYTLASTLPSIRIPCDELLCKVMFHAIQPDKLRKRIEERMGNGCGPEYTSRDQQSWRMDADKHLRSLRRLIREQVQYLDDLNTLPAEDREREAISNDATTWIKDRNYKPTLFTPLFDTMGVADILRPASHHYAHHNHDNKAPPIRNGSSKNKVPVCCLEECNRPCHQYKHGHYATTCTREHHKVYRERHRRKQQRVRTVPDS